jgi:hypothetical protein
VSEQHQATAETQAKLEQAARLRVEGATWEVVAGRLGGYSSGDSARKTLAGHHPELWQAAMERAREEYGPQVEAEAILTQRELMRPTRQVYDEHGKPVVNTDGTPKMQARDERVRQSAAHSLLNHASRTRRQQIEMTLKGGLRHSHSRMEELSDEELEQVVAAERAADAAAAEAAQGGQDDGAD